MLGTPLRGASTDHSGASLNDAPLSQDIRREQAYSEGRTQSSSALNAHLLGLENTNSPQKFRNYSLQKKASFDNLLHQSRTAEPLYKLKDALASAIKGAEKKYNQTITKLVPYAKNIEEAETALTEAIETHETRIAERKTQHQARTAGLLSERETCNEKISEYESKCVNLKAQIVDKKLKKEETQTLIRSVDAEYFELKQQISQCEDQIKAIDKLIKKLSEIQSFSNGHIDKIFQENSFFENAGGVFLKNDEAIVTPGIFYKAIKQNEFPQKLVNLLEDIFFSKDMDLKPAAIQNKSTENALILLQKSGFSCTMQQKASIFLNKISVRANIFTDGNILNVAVTVCIVLLNCVAQFFHQIAKDELTKIDESVRIDLPGMESQIKILAQNLNKATENRYAEGLPITADFFKKGSIYDFKDFNYYRGLHICLARLLESFQLLKTSEKPGLQLTGIKNAVNEGLDRLNLVETDVDSQFSSIKNLSIVINQLREFIPNLSRNISYYSVNYYVSKILNIAAVVEVLFTSAYVARTLFDGLKTPSPTENIPQPKLIIEKINNKILQKMDFDNFIKKIFLTFSPEDILSFKQSLTLSLNVEGDLFTKFFHQKKTLLIEDCKKLKDKSEPLGLNLAELREDESALSKSLEGLKKVKSEHKKQISNYSKHKENLDKDNRANKDYMSEVSIEVSKLEVQTAERNLQIRLAEKETFEQGAGIKELKKQLDNLQREEAQLDRLIPQEIKDCTENVEQVLKIMWPLITKPAFDGAIIKHVSVSDVDLLRRRNDAAYLMNQRSLKAIAVASGTTASTSSTAAGSAAEASAAGSKKTKLQAASTYNSLAQFMNVVYEACLAVQAKYPPGTKVSAQDPQFAVSFDKTLRRESVEILLDSERVIGHVTSPMLGQKSLSEGDLPGQQVESAPVQSTRLSRVGLIRDEKGNWKVNHAQAESEDTQVKSFYGDVLEPILVSGLPGYDPILKALQTQSVLANNT